MEGDETRNEESKQDEKEVDEVWQEEIDGGSSHCCQERLDNICGEKEELDTTGYWEDLGPRFTIF